MNQTLSISGFATGLTTFLGLATEMIDEHTRWSDFTATPLGALHLLILGGAFVMMIAGALGIQLPRSSAAHGDRATDPQAAAPTLPTAPPSAPIGSGGSPAQ